MTVAPEDEPEGADGGDDGGDGLDVVCAGVPTFLEQKRWEKLLRQKGVAFTSTRKITAQRFAKISFAVRVVWHASCVVCRVSCVVCRVSCVLADAHAHHGLD
jgi:hypothetical protein